MALEKLKIFIETRPGTYGSPFSVLFNPTQITLDKMANWSSAPTAERDAAETRFTYGNPYSLTLDLFFDTYEAGTDVRTFTRQVAALVTVQGELHHVPAELAGCADDADSHGAATISGAAMTGISGPSTPAWRPSSYRTGDGLKPLTMR